MSKREIRAKRLVAAVLLAISVQMWSAPPLWAAEASVQTETSAAGEPKETKDAKAADSETGGEADAGEEETVVVPVIGYSTRSAAGSDYGVMPLADTAVDGALTGVTSINGSELVVDKVNNNFFIGTIQDGGSFDKNFKNNAAIGLDIRVDKNGNNSVFGIEATGWGESASVFGYNATADNFGSSFGAGARSEDGNGSAFGYNAEAWGGTGNSAFGYNAKAINGGYGVAVGAEAKVESAGGIAIGALANVGTGVQTYGSGIAIGREAHTNNDLTIALGYNAESTFESSIAVGANSATTAAYQVAFGTGEVKTVDGAEVVTWTNRRSLAGISDIDMEGALTGVNKIDMKNGALTGVSTINGNVLVPMNEDVTNKSLAIGTGAAFSPSSATIYKNAIAIGNGAYAGGNGSLAIGFDSNGNAAAAGGVGSISLNAMASGDHNVIISGWADAYDSVVIGYGAGTDNSNVVAIGNGSYGGADGTALGYAAGTDGRNSVAIGAKSSVASGDDNKVSFGHKVGDLNYADGSDYSDDMFRSLINVADIDMHGNISLGGEWKENATSGLYESNGKGELNGVTSINGVIFAKDSMNNDGGLLIGTPASGTSFYGATSVMIGLNIDNSAIDAVGIGNNIKLTGDGSVAIGYGAEAMSNMAMYPTAIGFYARAIGDDVVAIGAYSYAEHEYSVALGDDSSTSAENQVSFGHKAGDKFGDGGRDTYRDDLFRSLVNVADIEMHGNISLGGEWKENTTSGLYESNGKGELNGVTSINGVIFAKDSMHNQEGLLIGTLAPDTYYSGGFSVMIGTDIDNQAIDAVGIGNNIKLTGDGSVAIGNGAQSLEDGIAIGFSSHAIGYDVVAIGTYSYSEYANSVALGSKSVALEENQVSFGHKADDKDSEGDTYGSDLFRSLVNVADIEMHGALTGVTGIDGVTVSGTDASTGLTVGGNAVIGKTDTPFSSTGFAVAKDGAVTAKTVNGATITGTGFNGVTLSTDGKVNGAVITSNSFNGVKLEKGADSHYKVGDVDVTKMQTDVAGKADAATTLTGYGITDAYTKTETDTAVGKKADKATTLTGYGIADAYTKTETDTAIGKKADKATTLTGYGIADAYTKTETDTAIGKKADKATTLTGYGITDAYTKTAADEKITAATADMATKTQVTADIGTAKTALESAYQAADTALSDRAAALETAATGMSYDAGKNTTTFTGGVTATLLTAGEFKVGATGFGFGNDGALTAKTVNGIEIKKDESKVMVGGIDLTALSNGDVVTDNTKGIGRNQDTATTTIETNTAISSSGITTNAVTASGTVKAGEFVEGSQKLSDKYAAKTALADYTTTTDMNTKFADYATTTAVDTKLADYAKSDSVYSKAAADTAFAKAGDVDTLKTTVGDTDGGLVKDVKDLQSGKADKATTLAGYGIADAYTQTEINEKIVEATKDLATSATVTDIQSGLEEVTGKTAGLSYDTASGSSKFSGSVVIGNEGAKTHTQITDDAIIFGEGTDKQVTVDASGIHVGKKAAGGIALYADADGTHIDHTSLVTGSVTADNLNGVAISGNATDGLSVGGVSIKALSERLDSLEQDGVATADMGGIKRTDVVENSGKTIIEDTTSFTKDGLKTANLEAATAALGGVNFAAGAVTGVSSINGVVFGSDGKIGGVSLSGGKVDGVDVGWLDQRVKSLEDNGTGGGGTGGGGSSANTSGIHKPDRDTTNIEGNTSITTDGIDTNKVNASDSIVVADGEKNKTVISKDGILVAEGEKNQVKINEDGIHVGKNSSVVNDTDGFITDKGLYIGVSSSSDTSTAKFSVAPNGNLSSKAGDYGFSNTSADGAKFTHSGDTAYGTGSQLDTTIQGNKVTTGRIDTDELYVDGNKVTVAGGTISQTDAVNNHLSGADADGNTVTNDFKTSAVNGTTQAAEKTSADGKESTKTVNNTSAGGTGVTTSKTTTDSKDNVTVKESSFGTNEKGMTLSTSNKVTDKDGKVTKDTSGTTTMTGDSISVSKTTTTTEKDADGNEKEVTKTSGTTIGSGEVTLKREDGSTIEVGSAIEGMQSDMRELDGRVNRMGVEIKEVGALSAALAGLHPQPENANSRADFAMAVGSYEGKQALAVGGFYRPDKRTMLSIGASTTSSKHMMNMGISIALDRLPEAERRAKEAAKAAGVEQETLNRVLERLAALEQDNRRLQADNEKRDVAYEKLAADYTQLKEKYIEETADRQQPEQAEAEE